MNRRTVWLVILGAVGVACLVVGLAVPPRALADYPARIEPGSAAVSELVASLERIESAATSGDVGRLREALTARYLTDLERQIGALGGEPIDAIWLHEAGSFLGDARDFEFRGGIGAGPRAWVVFSVGGGALAGHELRAFEFDARDGRPRLNRKLSRRLGDTDDAGAAAGEWLRTLGTEWP